MLATFLPLLPVLVLFCLLALRFWRGAIVGVLLWALIEGAVRKWLLPDFQSALLLAKDFVLICAYLGYLVSPRASAALGPKSGTLLLLVLVEALFCTLQLTNPNAPSLLLSLFGLKNYLIYIPLAFIMPDIVVDRRGLRRALLWPCYLTLPIAALGLYQFSQPPSSWVNKYVSHEEGVETAVAVFGEQEADEAGFEQGRARTSSTFSYIGGFTTFLMLSAPLAAALLLAAVPRRGPLLIVGAALALSIGAAATTGSRTPVLVFAGALPLLVLIAGVKRLLSPQLAVRLALGGAVIGIATLALFSSAFSALDYRASSSDDPLRRLASPITETVDAFETSPFIGTGIGSNSNAATNLMGSEDAWWLNGYAYEIETARILQELGVIGCILVYLPKLFVILLILAQLRSATSRATIAAQMAALIFVLVHLVLFTVNNPTGGLLYWTMVGLAIAAARIERAERHAHDAQQDYLARGYPLGDVAFA